MRSSVRRGSSRIGDSETAEASPPDDHSGKGYTVEHGSGGLVGAGGARIKPAALLAVCPPILQKVDIDDRNHRQSYLAFPYAATSRLRFERWREDVRDQVVTIEPVSGTRVTYVVATYDGVQMHPFMGGALVALGGRNEGATQHHVSVPDWRLPQ